MKHKVMLVDDHAIVREGLRLLLESTPDFSVCGEAEGVVQALSKMAEVKPDLMILDITLSDSVGVEVIDQILLREAKLPILVLSMHDELLYAERVLRAGARGYLMKGEPFDTLLAAARQVVQGKFYTSPTVKERLLSRTLSNKTESGKSALDDLSDRELQVFELIGLGKGSSEIARQLHLSVKTIEINRANIKRKLGIRTGAELVHFAIHWLCNRAEPGDPIARSS